MAETASLAPRPALGGADVTAGAVRIRELDGLGVVSAAVSGGGRDAFAAALRQGYGPTFPDVGRLAPAADGTTIARLQMDQVWLVRPDGAGRTIEEARARLETAAWLTDQSDGWAALELSDGDGGRAVREALRRLITLDVDRMPADVATRTVMAHLAVVILGMAETVTLLSPRSSAGDFLRAIERAAREANMEGSPF